MKAYLVTREVCEIGILEVEIIPRDGFYEVTSPLRAVGCYAPYEVPLTMSEAIDAAKVVQQAKVAKLQEQLSRAMAVRFEPVVLSV